MKTIKEVCKLTGVTRRTLQEYANPNVDLLHPTAKTEGGYWLYDEEAIVTLMAIQIFVAAGYKRAVIRDILKEVKAGKTNYYAALEEAKQKLEDERRRIDQLITYLSIIGEIGSGTRKPSETDMKIGQLMIEKGLGELSFKDLIELGTEPSDTEENDFPEEGKEIAKQAMLSFASIIANSDKRPDDKAVQKEVKNLYDAAVELIPILLEEEDDVDEFELTKELFHEMILEMIDEKSKKKLGEKNMQFFYDAVECFLSDDVI